jgi:hypothetical protein
MRALFRLFVVLLPWALKRVVLRSVYGYDVHATARIGVAWVFPARLVMGAHSRIDHLTVCKGMELVSIGERGNVGLNWISAYPLDLPPHFTHLTARNAHLIVEEHASITNRHIIECTEEVGIGAFATLAGFRSQILTHSIDLAACRQDAKPVRIGRYCFVGTAVRISLVQQRLYAGVPAKAVSQLDPGMKYFTRTDGYVT